MPQSDGAAAQAQDKAHEAAGQAQEKAQQAAGQVKEQARTQVDQRSTQAGEQVSQQAGDIRTVAEKLREEGKDGPAKVAEQAADRIEKVGSYLKQSDADRLLGDVEDFARQRPMAVVAAWGFVVGDGDSILSIVPVNTEDNILHLLIGVAGVGAAVATPTEARASAPPAAS